MADAEKLKAFEDWMNLSALKVGLVQAIGRAGADAPHARARLGEFVDPEATIWQGDADLPQPLAQFVGGPYDGKTIANDRAMYELPDSAPMEFKWHTAEDEEAVFHRFVYLRKPVRLCPDAAEVATFELAS